MVGLGYFGSHHARHYVVHPSAELVAVVDNDPARARAAAERFRSEALNDHRGLIGKVAAASIAVPTSEHYAVARDLIEAGVHVFIEKPIASDAGAAADLVGRAARRGAMVQVGHIERYAPAFRALRARVRAPKLISCVRKAPWSGRATDVDVVLDLMIHDIDLALTLAGSRVASVAASGVSVVTRLNDLAEARLTFVNGIVATLAASRVAAVGERTVTVGEPGRRLTADLTAQTLAVTSRGGEGLPVSEVATFDPADNLAAEIDVFLASIRTGKPPEVDGRAGLDAMKVADMILAAISRGRVSHPATHRRSPSVMAPVRTAAALSIANDDRIALFDLQRQRVRARPGYQGADRHGSRPRPVHPRPGGLAA